MPAGVVKQGRAGAGVTDAAVLGGRAGRPDGQDEEVEDEPPGEARRLDDARVAEELAEVAAQGRRGGGVRRAELGQQNARHRPWSFDLRVTLYLAPGIYGGLSWPGAKDPGQR